MGALYIVAGLIFVGIIVLFFIYYSQRMKMTSYTTCEVVRVEERVVRDERERREETVIDCKYTVRGNDYDIQHIIRGHNARAFPAGRQLTVWYNPNSPEMSRIKEL